MKTKRKKNRLILVSKLSIVTIFLSLFLLMLYSNFETIDVKTFDISRNRTLRSNNLLMVYNNKENITVKKISGIDNIISESKKGPVTFKGTLTGYGPDCEGCGGNLACPPRHNAKNGNIYHVDKVYGKLRILAADKRFPCGTVIRVSNLKGYKDFYAIVLDRGGAITGTKFDLLFEFEKTVDIGKKKVTYTVVRWGWNGKS